MLNAVSVRFPHIGINVNDLIRSFNIFGFEVPVYGVLVVLGIVAGMGLVIFEARRTWQDVDGYINMGICIILMGIIGGRLFNVIFMWDYYSHNLLQIFNIHNGGLSMYGGIIAAVITGIVFAAIKKISFLKMADTACLGLVLGQAIAGWGGFFGREAFGTYTDSLFAMQIKYDEVKGVMNQKILDHLIRYGGELYIQVHPVFLYESLWCFILFAVIMVCKRFKKFDGEVFIWYIAGYSIGKVWTEYFKADRFMIPGIGIPPVMVLASVIALVSVVFCLIKHIMAVRADKTEAVK